jgi:Mg-chelatase subunit ChlI
MASIVLGLIEAGLDPWLAALLVGIVVAAVGGALVARGRSGLATTDLTPKRTMETIQDDAAWVKERTS